MPKLCKLPASSTDLSSQSRAKLFSNTSGQSADLQKKIPKLSKSHDSATDISPQIKIHKSDKVYQSSKADILPSGSNSAGTKQIQEVKSVATQQRINPVSAASINETHTLLTNTSCQSADLQKEVSRPHSIKPPVSSTALAPEGRANQSGTAEKFPTSLKSAGTKIIQIVKSVSTQQRINPVLEVSVRVIPLFDNKIVQGYDPKDDTFLIGFPIPAGCTPTYSELTSVGDANFLIIVMMVPSENQDASENHKFKKYMLKFNAELRVEKIDPSFNTLQHKGYIIHLMKRR